MKCPFCGGSGVNETWVSTDKVSEYKQTCFKCHGKGEWDCTNEEFIRHCSTEELAKVLMAFYMDGNHDDIVEYGVEHILKWLKEKHTDG